MSVQGWCSLRAVREGLLPASFSLCWLSVGHLGSLTQMGHLGPCLHRHISSLCLLDLNSLYMRTQSYWNRAHPNDFIQLIQEPIQVRSYSEVLGLDSHMSFSGETQSIHNISLCICLQLSHSLSLPLGQNSHPSHSFPRYGLHTSCSVLPGASAHILFTADSSSSSDSGLRSSRGHLLSRFPAALPLPPERLLQ